MARIRFAPGMLLALSLVWGSTWIANDMLADLAAPLRTISRRYLLASVCLALAWGCRSLMPRVRRARRVCSTSVELSPLSAAASHSAHDDSQPTGHISGSEWLALSIVLGCTMFALPDLLLVWAAQHGVAHFAPLVYAALPLGLLLTMGVLRHAGILAVGAMLILLNGSLPLTGSRLLWTLLIALAVSFQGWSLVYARRHLESAASLRGVMVQLITAAVVLEGALRLWPDSTTPIPLRSWPASSLGALFLLAVPATAVAYPLYYRLLTWLEPAQLATTFWLQTLIALGESAWLLRIRPSWIMAAAAVVLVACSILILREDALNPPTPLRLTS